MGTHMVMQAMGPTTMESSAGVKPLPDLPSPTLTNPDMVLPDEPRRLMSLSLNSPPRQSIRAGRPSSPGCLRNATNGADRNRFGHSVTVMGGTAPKKEKRGLMSRKMMLLRSRTASGGNQVVATPPPSQHSYEDYGSAYSSSPTLMDVGNLAPEQPVEEERQSSADESSLGSEDMSTLPQFLAKYEGRETPQTDEELEVATQSSEIYPPSLTAPEAEARRRQQEEDEHTSALLSQRAEQILANAKKRLNLMEGNLRGARDLVQPLTAANLKRATSVGSSYAFPSRPYGTTYSARYDGLDQQSKPQHRLAPQASAPHLAQDYNGHARGYSEFNLPERPYTSLERKYSPPKRSPREAQDASWSNTLRGSRSYDSLGSARTPVSRERVFIRGSPDPNLEPLVEDDGQYHALSTPSSREEFEPRQPEMERSPSVTDDLREQMSSLKGKISLLKERAREDSLHRRSLQNLREPSPLNNATATAPEFFYTSSPSYGQPPLDTNAGVGWRSPDNSPNTPQLAQNTWAPSPVILSSRNAFAEAEQRVKEQQPGRTRQVTDYSVQKPVQVQPVPVVHKRTPSGAAVIQSSKQRYSHHRPQQSTDSTSTVGRPVGNHNRSTSLDDTQSDTGDTVYEDAESEPQSPPSVVAHEDREDAFDYKNFFLHSAMAAYSKRNSTSSDGSAASTETARGPTAAGAVSPVEVEDDEDDIYDGADPDAYPPPSPETPERLREIERNLHKRTMSNDSIDTLATFATATEGRNSPDEFNQPPTPLNWPMPMPSSTSLPTSRPGSRPGSRTVSRPSTAIPVKQPSPHARSDSSSERADSGVGGLPQRPKSSQKARKPELKTLTNGKTTPRAIMALASPPMSPSLLMDPATVAVKALLAPSNRHLGLKDNALLFGLVESLGKVVHRLQEGEETDYESRELRRRLDEARRVLEGKERGG